MAHPWLSWGRACNYHRQPVRSIKMHHLGMNEPIKHSPQRRGSRMEMHGMLDPFPCRADPRTSGSNSSAGFEDSISIHTVKWQDILVSFTLWAT
jgi:hypothetical protein